MKALVKILKPILVVLLAGLFVMQGSNIYGQDNEGGNTNESVNQNQSTTLVRNNNPFANAVVDTTSKNTTGYNSIPFDPEKVWLGMDDTADASYEIFGWYPHWFPDYYKELDFDNLSTVSYFSYKFSHSTGESATSYDWATTPMVDSADAHGCKILLTVSSFGQENNELFLNNSFSVTTMIGNLIRELKKREEADGVCLDFESIGPNERDEFTAMIEEMKESFAPYGYEIYLALPSVDHHKVYDFGKLNNLVDKSVIMAYGYAGKWSDPKPVAPLESNGYSLTKTVEYYTENMDSKNILLGLPIFGVMWNVEKVNGKDSVKWIGYRTLNYINTYVNQIAEIDSLSKASHISFPLETDTSVTREIWFNNEISFLYQIKLIKEEKLGGIGLWALGYDKNCPLLWDVIKSGLPIVEPDSISTDTTEVIADSPTWLDDFSSYVDRVFSTANDRQEFIFFILMLIIGFGAVAFIISLFDYRTREFFTTSKFFRTAFVGTVLLTTILLFLVYHAADPETGEAKINSIFMLIIGFVVGGVAYMGVSKIIKKKRSRLP